MDLVIHSLNSAPGFWIDFIITHYLGEGVELTAVQGDWLVEAHFDETEAFVLKQVNLSLTFTLR